MKEYIERAAVHDLVKSLPKYQMFNYDRTESRGGISPDDIDFGVDKIPVADVAPVRHGRWFGEPVDIGGSTAMECSECHKVRVVDDYCSACGAKMDGEEDEHGRM